MANMKEVREIAKKIEDAGKKIATGEMTIKEHFEYCKKLEAETDATTWAAATKLAASKIRI